MSKAESKDSVTFPEMKVKRKERRDDRLAQLRNKINALEGKFKELQAAPRP